MNFAALVGAVIPEDARDKPIELWWQNEARVGQQGSLTHLWADRGSRPPAPRDQRHDWARIPSAPSAPPAASVRHWCCPASTPKR